MFQEYQDDNFWLSLTGYPFAVFTGIYRTLNDKHWVGDVVAGAGIGILSTEAAYWLFPKISKIFHKPNSAIEKKEYFSILISNCVAVEKNKR